MLINQFCYRNWQAFELALCPALCRAFTTIRKPRRIGGCGPTMPSVQRTPTFKGVWSFASPSFVALFSSESSISCCHGILTTPGSRSHGFVDRIDFKTSLTASIDVPRTPTDEQ